MCQSLEKTNTKKQWRGGGGGGVRIEEGGAPQLLPTLPLLRMDYNKTRGSLRYTVDAMICWSHNMKNYCMEAV